MFRIIFQMSFFCKDEVQIIIGLSKLKSNLNMFIKIQNLNGKVIKFKQNFKQMNFNPFTFIHIHIHILQLFKLHVPQLFYMSHQLHILQFQRQQFFVVKRKTKQDNIKIVFIPTSNIFSLTYKGGRIIYQTKFNFGYPY